jgi:LEA14-like dessication related protein
MKKFIPLFLCLIFIAGCVQVEPPKASYVDAKITKVTLEGAQINFNFNVQNKNPIPIDVSGYSYKIYINNRELLSESRGGFNVPANSTKVLSIPVFVRYDKVLDSILGIAANILAGNMYFDYKIEGSISVKAVDIKFTTPLKASGRVPIPKELLKM